MCRFSKGLSHYQKHEQKCCSFTHLDSDCSSELKRCSVANLCHPLALPGNESISLSLGQRAKCRAETINIAPFALRRYCAVLYLLVLYKAAGKDHSSFKPRIFFVFSLLRGCTEIEPSSILPSHLVPGLEILPKITVSVRR